jgi:hypothetical protein
MWNLNSLRIGHIVDKNHRMHVINIHDFMEFIEGNIEGNVYKPICLNEALVIAYGFKKLFNKQHKTVCYKRESIVIKANKAFDNFCSETMPYHLSISYLHELQDFFSINSYLSLTDVAEATRFVNDNRAKFFPNSSSYYNSCIPKDYEASKKSENDKIL